MADMFDEGSANIAPPEPEESLPVRPEDQEFDDDEGADFLRFLAAEGIGSRLAASKIPSRGTKDFEPHGTESQKSALRTSRDAMYSVLSQERTHPRGAERAVWDPESNGAWVVKPAGKWMTTVGKAKKVPMDASDDDQGQRNLTLFYLLPEETLWLLERGTLDLRWPAAPDEEENEGLSMTVQAAHAVLISHGDQQSLAIEKYTVYQYLKRAGYVVLRAEENWHNIPRAEPVSNKSQKFWDIILNKWTWSQHDGGQDRRRFGPLVAPRMYRNYNDVYRLMALTPYYSPLQSSELHDSESGPKITYHVYKPTSSFKKSNPGPPDFYISVVNARELGLLSERGLEALLRQTPFHPPNADVNLYRKLKSGVRNVILAIVDQGVTSFLNVSDAGFGLNPLWDRSHPGTKAGQKRGKFKSRHRKSG